jgi:hypothetical protein
MAMHHIQQGHTYANTAKTYLGSGIYYKPKVNSRPLKTHSKPNQTPPIFPTIVINKTKSANCVKDAPTRPTLQKKGIIR